MLYEFSGHCDISFYVAHITVKLHQWLFPILVSRTAYHKKSQYLCCIRQYSEKVKIYTAVCSVGGAALD